MSFDEPPEHEIAEYTFEDKPVLVTMISGGIVISLVVFFVFRRVMSSFQGLIFDLFPIILSLFVIILSIKRGLEVDALIKINTKTGWIYARNRIQYWEGYINQAVQLLVLQKQAFKEDVNSPLIYKLFLEIDDGSSYEILLTFDQAQNAIEVVKKAENALPTKD